MQTISFQLPEEMNKALEKYARELDRSKSYLVRAALEEYLEDVQDYITARRAKAKSKGESIPLDEVMRRLGVQ